MLVIGLSPLTDQPEAKATTTVTDGNCSIEVNNVDGVTIDESGNECVAEFKTTGINYNVTLPGTYDIKYLLVGGGGAGGAGSNLVPGSGGGGGQVVEGTATTGSLTISVGAGGVGADGGSSSLDFGTAVTAVGGKFPGDSTDTNLPKGGDSGEFSQSFSGGEGGGGNATPTTLRSYDIIVAPGGGGHSGNGYQAAIGTGAVETSSGFGGQGLDTSATNIPSISFTSGFAGGGSGGIVEESGNPGTTSFRTTYDGGGQGKKTAAGSNGSDNTGGGGGGGGKNSSGGNGGSGFASFSFTLPTLVDVGDNCTLVGSIGHVDVSTEGDDCIVEFKSTDVDYEFKVPSNITEAWVLAVGGGGGGGCLGGGGAGGYIEFDQNNKWKFPFPETSDRKLSIRVGDGGLGAKENGDDRTNDKTEDEMRGESTFIGDDLSQYYETTENLANYTNAVSIPNDQSHIQAIGGGGGACLVDSSGEKESGYYGASAGGSGLKRAGTTISPFTAATIYGTDGDQLTLGNNSASLSQSGFTNWDLQTAWGSGGGGAGGAGNAETSGTSGSDSLLVAGAGGVGNHSSISGSDVGYAGGGAGGAYENIGDTFQVRGGSRQDGGGFGGVFTVDTEGTQKFVRGGQSGSDGLGGGGGGGNGANGLSGGDGGSGIAIIRFTIPPTPVNVTTACDDTNFPSGVTADDSSGSCVVEFTTSGITYDVTLPASVTFDYLLVGGGGGGGGSWSSTNSGGGGGGGEVLSGNQSTAVSGLTVRVGNGGAGGEGLSSFPSSSRTDNGSDGGETSLTPSGSSAISASPGEGGIGPGNDSNNVDAGGKGGDSGSAEVGGGGINANSGGPYSGGGGGGNEGPGVITTYSSGSGDGGPGTDPTGFDSLQSISSNFGGGGGGGISSGTAGTGFDGGGDGGVGAAGANGAPNSGGGGGGGSANNAGGDGASGFAAISFSLPFATPVLSEPTPTEDGFEVTITNYQAIQDLAVSEGGAETDVDDDDWSATADSSASASVSGDKVTVTGLTPTEDATASATVTVTLTPGGSLGDSASATKLGSTLKGQSALTFTPSSMKYLDTQSLSVTGGDGTGATSFAVTSGTCTITGNVITAGTDANDCVVEASKAADSVYASKTASATITVNKADREIAFTSAVPTDPVVNDTYTPTVSITNKNDADLTDAPDSLTASFSVNTSQTDNYDNSGSSDEVCSISSGVVSFQAEGTCQMDAVSDSSETLYTSSSTISQVIEIGIANQNITFESIADKTITSAPFTINPTSSAGLTVTATVDASTTSNCSITGNVVQILSVGECIITATQSGVTGQFAAATPITQSFDIAPVVPGPPILESIGFDSETINISFTAPSFNGGAAIAGYSMVATDGAGNSFANNDCLASATTCSITGLTNGTQYTTTLVAINSAGESSAATAPAITPAAAADSVSDLLLTNGDGELTASWTKPTSFGGGSFTSYDLDLSAAGSSVATASITNSDTTTRTFTGLTNGVEYELELVVISTANTSRLQSNTSTTTGIPATAPSKVRSITAEIESFDKAFISWVEPESNGGLPITSYELSTGTQSTTTDTFRELTDLSGGDTVITIKAINAVGESTETFTLTLPSPPAPPSPSPSPSPPSFTPGNNDEDSDDEDQGPQSENNPSEGTPRPENPEDNGFRPTPPTPKTSPDGTPAPATPAAEIIGSDETPEITNEDSKIVTKGSNWEIRVGIGSANDDASDDNTDNNTDNNQPNDAELTPELTFIAPMRSKIALEAQGLKPNTLMQAWVFSDPQYIGDIEVDENGELIGELDLPETLLPGNHTIQLASINASGETVVINKPITIKGKLTVGTFKGFIAIYSKDLEGQKLSARVAGKWLVQDPIDTFKDFSYGRVVRFTGAGYEINVDLYLNREFFQRVTTVTR